MIQAIVFDCFGVLTVDKWKEFLAAQPPAKAQPIRDIHAAFDKHLISYEDFRAEVAEISGASVTDLDDVFLHRTHRPKNEPLLLFIKELHQKYKIGLLSNVGTGWIRDEFLTTAEQQLFDVMIFSFEVGYAKPDPEIFQITAEQLNVEPSACLLVDDAETNCAGARTAGWQAILYQDLPKLRVDLKAIL